MPDEPIQPAPAAPTSAAPAPSAAPSGTASLMADMDAMLGDPSPAKPEAAAEPPKPDKPSAKTETKPASTTQVKDESGKFVAKPEPVREKDPVQLRKRLAEVESDLHKTRTEKETTVGELQRKMAELEKRPFLTEEQQKRYSALEERSKQLEAQLYARNYAESPEYKEKFQKRWQAKYQTSIQEVGKLQVRWTDPESGEEKSRLATQADFERVRSLRGSEAAQLDEAENIFGKRAVLVVKYCNELDAIEQQAQEEISTRRSKYDEEMSARGQQTEKMGAEIHQSAAATEADLKQKFSDWFGKSEDPEIDGAMQKGLDFVDSTTANAERLTPAERGSRLAVIRMWASAFPRNVLRIQKQESEITTLKAAIAKLQGSDPGEGGELGGGEKKSETATGTAGLLKDF